MSKAKMKLLPNSKRYWIFNFYWKRFLFGVSHAELRSKREHLTTFFTVYFMFWKLETIRHWWELDKKTHNLK